MLVRCRWNCDAIPTVDASSLNPSVKWKTYYQGGSVVVTIAGLAWGRITERFPVDQTWCFSFGRCVFLDTSNKARLCELVRVITFH